MWLFLGKIEIQVSQELLSRWKCSMGSDRQFAKQSWTQTQHHPFSFTWIASTNACLYPSHIFIVLDIFHPYDLVLGTADVPSSDPQM